MSQRLDIDPELLRKYDVRGPRYTSYPTAPWFSQALDETACREAARRAGAVDARVRRHPAPGVARRGARGSGSP